MSPLSVITIALLLGCTTTVQGLQCNEGFNMTFGGIPFYHWAKRQCASNSKCFGQELKATYGVEVVMRYGSCLSAAYASYLDCNKLFGPDSTFDPALLLDMVPDIEKQLTAMVQDFTTESVKQLKILFSNGQGTSEFIDGVFKFYQNLGLNMEKAEPLKVPLANMLIATIEGNPTTTSQRAVELLNAIGSLDTANTKYTDAIYKFLGNLMPPEQIEQIKGNPALKPTIERIPGLVRSMLPEVWSPALWYDIVFDLLDDFDLNNPKKTATDMVATIKTTYTIPDDVKVYVYPFFDAIPDLVEKLSMGNFNYAGNWSLELLKHFSERNAATTVFSDAMINFIEKIAKATLQYEFRATIEFVPGLFYKFFPGDKAEIEKVYSKMVAGFNSFNFTDLNQTAQPTKLSELVIGFVEKNTGATLGTMERALIINFSRMFYNLLDDYSSYVEKFFQILNDGFATWPTINAGKLIEDLIVGMNGTVPPGIQPLLTHLQTVITAAMTSIAPTGYDATALYNSFTIMINAYKEAFPNSPFPELVERYIVLVKNSTEIDDSQPDAAQKVLEYNLEMQYWSIDLQFALFNAVNDTTDELTQMLIKAFPAYETYIKLMKSLKADDIKELIKQIVAWINRGPPYMTQGFVDAIKPTVMKITKSIKDVLGDLRKLFQPDSCKDGSCDTDLCNVQDYISSQQPFTKALSATTSTTTASGERITADVLLNVVTLWMAPSTASATTASGERITASDERITSSGERITANVLLNVVTLWIARIVFFG